MTPAARVNVPLRASIFTWSLLAVRLPLTLISPTMPSLTLSRMLPSPTAAVPAVTGPVENVPAFTNVTSPAGFEAETSVPTLFSGSSSVTDGPLPVMVRLVALMAAVCEMLPPEAVTVTLLPVMPAIDRVPTVSRIVTLPELFETATVPRKLAASRVTAVPLPFTVRLAALMTADCVMGALPVDVIVTAPPLIPVMSRPPVTSRKVIALPPLPAVREATLLAPSSVKAPAPVVVCNWRPVALIGAVCVSEPATTRMTEAPLIPVISRFFAATFLK